jgi:hypothetical protein
MSRDLSMEEMPARRDEISLPQNAPNVELLGFQKQRIP